jgi:hypothetical protein
MQADYPENVRSSTVRHRDNFTSFKVVEEHDAFSVTGLFDKAISTTKVT